MGAGLITSSLHSFMTIPIGTGKRYEGRKLNVAPCGLGNYSTYHLAIGQENSQYCQLAGILTGTPAKAETWRKRFH